MRSKRVLYGAGLAIGVAVVFQLFFRYAYVPTGQGYVLRVDRLTATSCYVGTQC